MNQKVTPIQCSWRRKQTELEIFTSSPGPFFFGLLPNLEISRLLFCYTIFSTVPGSFGLCCAILLLLSGGAPSKVSCRRAKRQDRSRTFSYWVKMSAWRQHDVPGRGLDVFILGRCFCSAVPQGHLKSFHLREMFAVPAIPFGDGPIQDKPVTLPRWHDFFPNTPINFK